MEKEPLFAVFFVPAIVFATMLGTIYLKSRSMLPQQLYAATVPGQFVEPPPITPPRVQVPQAQVAPQQEPITTTAQGLIEAGKRFPGAKVCNSQPHPFLMQLATQHAKYMASVHQGGHQAFNQRFQQIISAGVGHSAAEICAESWQWQANSSMFDLGMEMFKCWRQSPGHWRTASGQHRYFGADMAQGRNGIWYACIIVAD